MKYIKSPRKTTEREKYQFRDQVYPEQLGKEVGIRNESIQKGRRKSHSVVCQEQRCVQEDYGQM